ncbi:MAG TPA: hypothetical protein PLR39_06575 [Treponemataceae bacterium]|nr:hypothetical protein [Treponemataceae bacterium]
MKKIWFFLIFLPEIFCCTGCISYYATPLTSNSIKGTIDTVGPAFTNIDEGWHPYASGVYFDKQLLSDLYSSAETMRGGALTAGINYHKKFDKENAIYPFIGSALSASLLQYTPYFTEEQSIAYESAGIDISRPGLDYSAELTIKPGISFYTKHLLSSYYLIALAEYENGEYTALRKRADGIQSTYNLVDNEFSFGFGFGVDIQSGIMEEADIGLNVECCSVFNKTQSVPYAFVENNVIGRPSLGGELHRFTSFRYGPYIDYKNMRLSCLMADKETFRFMSHINFKRG